MGSIVTRLQPRALAFVTVVGMACGCASARSPHVASSPPSAAVRLTLLDTVVMPVVTTPPDGRRESWFGSLSGLARDPRSGRYVAVIDDRSPSRLAWLDITADDGRLFVRRGAVSPTHPAPGVDPRLVVGADLEAIVSLDDGTWIASEEGHESTGKAGEPPAGLWQPALLTLTSDFTVTRVQHWPERFAIGPASGGIREQPGLREPDPHAGRPSDRRAGAAAVRGSARAIPERPSLQRRSRRPQPIGGARREGRAVAAAARMGLPAEPHAHSRGLRGDLR